MRLGRAEAEGCSWPLHRLGVFRAGVGFLWVWHLPGERKHGVLELNQSWAGLRALQGWGTGRCSPGAVRQRSTGEPFWHRQEEKSGGSVHASACTGSHSRNACARPLASLGVSAHRAHTGRRTQGTTE